MNRYVRRYFARRNEGFQPLQAFGIVASSIAISGTIEDLKILDRVFQEDMNKEVEEVINEPTTRSVSAV